MAYFDYKKPAQGSYLDRRNPPYLRKSGGLGVVGDLNPLPDISRGGGFNFTQDRYNPVKDNLEDGSIMEDWIPRQPTNLHLLYRRIYLRDAIAGTVVDTYSTLPWGKIYELIGVDDHKVLQMFHDMLESINIWHELPKMSREFMIIGRTMSNLAFNERLGLWDALLPLDPDQVKLTPTPFAAEKPLMDVLSSPGWRSFARSVDPRVVDMKERMNPALIEMLQNHSGYIPLDPLNTIFVPRSVNQYDHIGTSLFSRILPAWAYEMALWNASLTGVRRRNRSIMLITAGIEETWEPTDPEMESLVAMFTQADEDPTGAVAAVRNGVDISEVRDPTAIWGISQEFEFLSTIKMRSLGISEAYLSGETNVSNMESARTSMGKAISSFRDHFITEIFQKQLFPTFARLHNMQKRTQAELSHNIRVQGHNKAYISAKAAMDIPLTSLIMPQLITEDTMRPEQDIAYLDLLEKLKDQGVPIPLRIWASSAGYDLDKAIAMMDDDITMRRRLAQIGGQLADVGEGASAPGGGGGSEDFFEGGAEGPPSPGPVGPGGEQAGTDSNSATLPPRWTAESSTILPFPRNSRTANLDRVAEAIKHFKSAPLSQALAKIEPKLLAELSLPSDAKRLLVPYRNKI